MRGNFDQIKEIGLGGNFRNMKIEG